MASPDTDELATVPLPAGEESHPNPARTEPGRAEADRAEPLDGAEAATAPQDPDGTAPEASAPARQGGRWWRGFTGSLAAGLAILAVGVLVVGAICLYTGVPGPGATLLIGHPVAAALALAAQRIADRRNGPRAMGAGAAVVLFTISAMTLFWLT